jgi:hypothetical protein
VTPTEFRACFPDGDFNLSGDASLTDGYIQKFLDAADPLFNVSLWTSAGYYSEGLAMYVADRIQASKRRKARGLAHPDNGATTEKHVGPVGASFDSELLNKQAGDALLGTDYGRRYCELRDMVGLGGTVGAGQ